MYKKSLRDIIKSGIKELKTNCKCPKCNSSQYIKEDTDIKAWCRNCGYGNK